MMNSEFEKEYYESPRSEMLPLVPLAAKKLLELGCGTGSFASQIKQRNDCEVWGIELVEKQARKASEVLDKVIVGDVTTEVSALPERYFDCVICNDILEHLADPYTILKKLKDHITANGVLVASIPNVRYYRVVKDLLIYGDWKYKESGVLDKTHLRFFTRKSIIRELAENGWYVEYIAGINPSSSKTFKVLNLLMLGRIADIQYRQFALVASIKNPG